MHPIPERETTREAARMYLALELGNRKWKVACGNGKRFRMVEVEARDLVALERALDEARKKLNLGANVPVFSCYEAGADGFWLHRWLTGKGIVNVVVDSSSIEVNRKARRAKTDRLDAQKLLTMLLRHVGGEPKVWQTCRVPTVEQEDDRQPQRELRALLEDETRVINQIRAQLKLFGLAPKGVVRLAGKLEELRGLDDQLLPQQTLAKLKRMFERRRVLARQIAELKQERRKQLEAALQPAGGASAKGAPPPSPEQQRRQTVAQKVFRLLGLQGIGPESSWLCVTEFFAWREFRNRRQVAGSAGLCSVPYDSGDSEHDQGISKSGNRRVRLMMVQISWGWLQYQPRSELTLWYQRKFGAGGKASRKRGIVALARRLLIALWRYVEFGEVPAGAQLKELIPLT